MVIVDTTRADCLMIFTPSKIRKCMQSLGYFSAASCLAAIWPVSGR